METEDNRGLPASLRLPHEAMVHNITPFFKIMTPLNVAQSEIQGKPVYDPPREMIELRFAGDRNYAPVMPADSMSRKIGTRVVTYAERFAEQYRAFIMGDDQKAGGTALEMLIDYGITPAQLSICRALKIYSIEALHSLEGPNLKNLGMNANELKKMARRFMEDREKRPVASEDVSDLRAEIERLKALIPAQQTAPEEIDQLVKDADSAFETWEDELLKEFIAEKTGSKPRGNPSHATLVSMAEELSKAAA